MGGLKGGCGNIDLRQLGCLLELGRDMHRWEEHV